CSARLVVACRTAGLAVTDSRCATTVGSAARIGRGEVGDTGTGSGTGGLLCGRAAAGRAGAWAGIVEIVVGADRGPSPLRPTRNSDVTVIPTTPAAMTTIDRAVTAGRGRTFWVEIALAGRGVAPLTAGPGTGVGPAPC